ncbi:unnamed protein product [Rotaria sp. Silwood2]|nr:unnamed protein product [Rotaria sp. Silwood2]CAF2898982.1 unnamed protein product [Rotaria sp. Silwood2]CAF4090294.1 unnamed protein product [Rotaria sp. Silwood2]CAF4119364.1 unnamed protein product [Rotaria sp. Silwood2]
MAITSYISFISLTYCVFILSICQTNLSSALDQSQSENQLFPIQQQDGRSVFLIEYLRNNYPFKQQQQQQEPLYDPPVYLNNQEKSNIQQALTSHLNWFKRDVRLTPVNKRMLCFFHAVNCFG